LGLQKGEHVMAVVRIDALCECEGCAKRFGVELDLSGDLRDGFFEDFEALVRDTVRGGNATCYTWGVRGKATVDRIGLSYSVTVQADLLLCDICSRKCDEVPIAEALTRDQVNEALGLPKGTT
jgi:hypothetical protein